MGVRVLAPVVTAVLVAGCAVLPGAPPLENGRFPRHKVVAVTPECQVLASIAPRLQAMLAAANADGVGLVPEQSSFLPPGVPGPPRIESCYRSYEMQVWWRDYYCSIGKCGNAAEPGTSKHGWGRAVDLQDQIGELTFESPGYQWLVAHAAAFGFFQPASVRPTGANPEAWHWETEA
jgi:LAS superfamily LD-carboxypeptidase LdcB